MSGLLIDQYGRRSFVMLLSAAFICCAHLIFAFGKFTPIPALVMLGLGYSWYSSAIWYDNVG